MLTTKEQVKELQRCFKDPVHFINEYIKFYDTQHSVEIDLQLWPFQEEYARSFYSDRFVLALKSRQLGFTTVTLAMAIHEAIFHPHARIVIMAQTEPDAMNLLSNAKYMFDRLPDWMKPQVGRDSMTMLFFPKLNSSVEVKACSPKAGRSIQATHVILDEFAFYNISRKSLDEEIYTAIMPTVERGGRLTIISTPNGRDNLYYELINKTKDGKTPFKLFELTWRVHPERDEEWKAETLKTYTDPRKFEQEYECSFLQTGVPIFNSAYLKVGTVQQKYNPSHTYVIGADVAEGNADGDFSVAYVFDLNTLEQVAEIRGHFPLDKYALMLDELGRRYGNAILAPERNNHGHAVLLKLKELGYPNIYKHTDGKPGWLTSTTTKPMMIVELEEGLRTGEIKISSPDLLRELLAYQDLGGGKSGTGKGAHDDCVIAMAITFQLRRARRPRAWGPGSAAQLGF